MSINIEMAEPSASKRMKSDDQTQAIKSWTHSKASVVKLEHVWEIEHFSLQQKKKGKCILSSIFTDQRKHEKKWQLELFPRGDKDEHGEKISLFLTWLNPPEKNSVLMANFQLSLLDENLQVLSQIKWSVEQFDKDSSSWGGGFHLSYSKIAIPAKSDNNPLLPADTLIAKCELVYKVKNSLLSGISASLSFIPSNETWIHHFEHLLDTKSHSDVVVEVQTTKFDAHKLVLMARSPVFEAMFNSNLTENQTNILKIEDIEPEVFAEILRFIYTDQVENLGGMTVKLLAAADKYMLEFLKTKCEASLAETITVENCSDLLFLSDLHSADGLKKVVLEFVRYRSDAVVKTAHWKKLLKTARPQLLRDISVTLMARSKAPSV